MTATTLSDNSTAIAQLAKALRDNRLAEADEIATALGDAPPQAARLPLAEWHLRHRRFAQAAALFDRIPNLDIHGRLKRNGARNYAALAQHRPAHYQRLITATLGDRFRFAPLPGNRLSIADYRDPAKPILLTPGSDPVLAVQQTLQKLEARLMEGAAIGLVGIGDGFVLGTLSRVSPKLFMGMQVCIELFEPDLSLVHTCFMLHDYTGPLGPIEQKRFQWYIGSDWQDQYRAAIHGDLMLPCPCALVQQSTDRQLITPKIHEIGKELIQREATLREQNQAHYASLDASTCADVIAGQVAARKPRVLLLTSRFTTVLQYATRGVAEGFRELGWDAQVLIEPTDHHQISKLTMIETLARFKPDLVFQIDHLRYEHEDVFPQNLPFVCWIQDHLAHLTDAKAGQRVGHRDFVLTFASPLFVDTYRYPARQCIDMPMMLTSPRRQTPAAISGAPDLVYVSNVSRDPATLEATVLERTAPELKDLMRDAVRKIAGIYEAGGSLSSHHDMRRIISEVCAAQGHTLPDAQSARKLIEILWNPLNITLYRQQALAWVAQAADDLGLSLGLYGQGWESHPRFAKHARGSIENGEPLAQLTRSAKINLNLEPYTCFTHQRLLDGLVAGGFFLIRQHPGNTLLQELLNFLVDHFDDSVQTAASAQEKCPPSLRGALDDLLTRAACVTFEEDADPVRQVRCWQRAGVLIRQAVALPHLDDVTFTDAASCHSLMARYASAKADRESISQTQRDSIEQRLSFAAGMRMVTKRIVELLKNEGKTAKSSNSEATR